MVNFWKFSIKKDPMPHKEKNKEHIQFSKDEFGRDILLKDGFLQVMMEWEKPYMEACIDALKPSGDVLEIGFGLGYSASQIQKYQPKSHTIIECEPDVIVKGKEWAKKYPNSKITFIQGLWQDKLKDLGTFDAIFFDDYSPFSADEVDQIQENAKAIQKLEKNADVMHNAVKAMMQTMKGIKFTDAQVYEFANHLFSRNDIEYDMVIDFMQTLVEQGNITPQQEVKFLDAYEKKGKDQKKIEAPTTKEQLQDQLKDQGEDRLLHFYKLCLDKHMKSGSRMSSYVDFYQFKKQQQKFKDLIVSRPDVTFTKEIMHVDVPTNCKYYVGNQALILTITKR